MSLRSRKLAALWAGSALSFLAVTIYFRSYSVAIAHYGDSTSYMNVARAIATWHFAGLQVFQFWGVSYAVAVVAILGHLPFAAALIVTSAVSSAAVTILAGRLWGWTVAALMTTLSFEWMQRSLLGGSEPFFMLLLLAAFLCARSERWWLAALLASVATTVRPLGICALIAIGLVLLSRRDYVRFLYALATGLLIGALYTVPLRIYMHDALATVHSYESSRPLFGIPFAAILEGTLYNHPPLTNLLLSYSWIVLIIGGIALLAFSKSCDEFRRAHPVELAFALLYTFVICCYNYPQWALGNFARFAIPSIPFALMGWRQLLRAKAVTVPQMRAIVWVSAFVVPALAACSAYGIRNIVR